MTKDVDNWLYSDEVKKHFVHPQNFLEGMPKEGEFDAVGEVGSTACGDVMKIWLKIDPATGRIKDFKWQTWGCASAIASTSVFSEMVKENGGMTIEEALKIKPQQIIERLHGLPSRKIHCSVLADQALKEAVKNYRLTHPQ
jgi:NifU-like protein involved in Fe-S cluster formation